MIEVKIVPSEELHDVRFKVLWPHLHSSKEAVIDIDTTEGAIHLAAYKDNQVVGVASLFPQACARYPEMFPNMIAYRLRAMGVLHELQGEGVGAKIISFALHHLAQTTPAQVLWCDAREVAWGFYSRCGFQFAQKFEGYECEAYELPNVGVHKMMYFYLSNLQEKDA